MPIPAKTATREEIIKYCIEVLEKKGYRVQPSVPYGIDGHLRADFVVGSTVYEVRQTLDELSLYAGTGQGQVYMRSLRLRRLVVVGFMPPPDKSGKAVYVAANIEKENLAKVSFLDVDPFWEIVPLSYRWLQWTIASVVVIALAVFSVPLLREEVGCRSAFGGGAGSEGGEGYGTGVSVGCGISATIAPPPNLHRNLP